MYIYIYRLYGVRFRVNICYMSFMDMDSLSGTLFGLYQTAGGTPMSTAEGFINRANIDNSSHVPSVGFLVTASWCKLYMDLPQESQNFELHFYHIP